MLNIARSNRPWVNNAINLSPPTIYFPSYNDKIRYNFFFQHRLGSSCDNRFFSFLQNLPVDYNNLLLHFRLLRKNSDAFHLLSRASITDGFATTARLCIDSHTQEKKGNTRFHLGQGAQLNQNKILQYVHLEWKVKERKERKRKESLQY